MAYSVAKLSSVTDCDALTKLLEKEKNHLDVRVIVLNRQIKSYTAFAGALTADLVAVEAEIARSTRSLRLCPPLSVVKN